MSKLDETHKFFDSNVNDYERKHYEINMRTFMTVRQERVLELVDKLSLGVGAAALDAGCGPGYLLEALVKRGFVVSAVDASSEMLEHAKQRLRPYSSNLIGKLEVGDIENLRFSNEQFDLVCSTGVIEYLEEDLETLYEMFRVLKPGGYLVISVTNSVSPVNWLDGVVEYIKRRTWCRETINFVLRRIGNRLLIPRHFVVRKHRAKDILGSLRRTQFEIVDDVYFHFLPWPRPFDRVVPRLTGAIGRSMEAWGRSRLGPLGEGYLVLAKKPMRSARIV